MYLYINLIKGNTNHEYVSELNLPHNADAFRLKNSFGEDGILRIEIPLINSRPVSSYAIRY
jgi:hypothetical protein